MGKRQVRYFEDFDVGDVFVLGEVCLTEREIMEFGRSYDPQPFHVDPLKAEESVFKGLVASGFHTAASFMRLYVDEILATSASDGSPGIDEVRFLQPVRAGERLTAKVTVTAKVPSFSRRDAGIMRPRCELIRLDGEPVFSMILNTILRRRGES